MKLWEKRKPGQPPSFSSPQAMWELAIEYFKDCEDSFLKEGKVFCFQGEVVHGDIDKIRAMTQVGLCAYLNISVSTWHNYKSKPEYLEVTGAIEDVMFEQKFSGAAAGLLNANIIARDLGLTDKQEIIHGGDVTPWSSVSTGEDE